MQHKCGEMSLQVNAALGAVIAVFITAYFSHLDSKGSAGQIARVGQITIAGQVTNANQIASVGQITIAGQVTNVSQITIFGNTNATQADNAAKAGSTRKKSLLIDDVSPELLVGGLLFVYALVQTLITLNYVYHTFQIHLFHVRFKQLAPRLSEFNYAEIKQTQTESLMFRWGWRVVKWSQPWIPAISASLGWLAFLYILSFYLNSRYNPSHLFEGLSVLVLIGGLVLWYLGWHMPGFAEHHCLEEIRNEANSRRSWWRRRAKVDPEAKSQ